MQELLLWLFVINLGVSFGAGVYEHRIVMSRWMGGSPGARRWDAAAARADDTGRRFWGLASTVPLTLLTIASLVAGWQTDGPERGWWLAAALFALADRVLTFAYFIPTMVGLMRAAESPESIAIAARWWNLNYLRHAIVLVAWLAALMAFRIAR